MSEDRDEICLFSKAGIGLPHHAAPSDASRVAEYFRRTPHKRLINLVCANAAPEPADAAGHQLPLPLPALDVILVPRISQPYLDYGVYDSFRDVEALSKVALRLEACGIVHVGHLVQLYAQQVRVLARADHRALEAMEARLASAGLRLGMRLPETRGFTLPSRRCRQAR